MTEELRSAMREASEGLSAAINDVAERMNAVLASRGMKMAARSVLAGKLRKAAGRKDLNWQTLLDALCVKTRGEAVAALAAMIDPKGILTERDRQILDMWPRFEDGEPVWFGDEVDGLRGGIDNIDLYDEAVNIASDLDHMHLGFGERVERPVQSVLDANGVEIKVGDTVWHEDGSELCITGFGDVQDGETILYVEYLAGATEWFEVRSLSVTHTRPDSWERLEEDAADLDDMPCDFNAKDLIRRAKILAGIEVVE